MSVHLARELGAISGHGGGDNTAYGSIGTFLHKPVEPLSFRFLRRHPHTETGGERSRWMAARMSCKKFRDNEVRLQLHALAYNLATFLRCIELPEAMADWSLTSLQLKLIKIGARVVRHARAITFQLAEVAVTGPMVRAILAAIRRLRAPPSCA